MHDSSGRVRHGWATDGLLFGQSQHDLALGQSGKLPSPIKLSAGFTR